MKWWRVVLLILLLCPILAQAQAPVPISGFCVNGAVPAITSGLPSSNFLQGLIPRCTVTVVLSGSTTPATIYADANQTVLSNPFTANADGSWTFYVLPSAQIYSVVLSGGIPPNVYTTPRTLTNVSALAGGGGGTFIGYDVVTKLPQVNVTHPDFGVNMPIGTLTLGGNLACTSTPTGTISPPVNTTIGVQATVTLACANSQVVITDWLSGAGYDNTATATISGGGTSGATLTIGFSCTAGPAGNGLQSSCAIQQAVNWAGTVYGANGGPFPCVFFPPGNYLTDMTIRVPETLHVCGSGFNATSLQATQPHNNIMTITYSGGLTTPANVSGFGTSGSIDGITFTTQLKGTNGLPFGTTSALAGTVSTSGTTVTYVSGQNFSGLTNGTYITINGVAYIIATVTNNTILVLASSAGTQANVSYASTVYSGYDATFLEVNGAHYAISNLQFLNGGGRGITLPGADEEIEINNVWENAVRWPLDGMGQARDNIQNIFSFAGASLSASGGYYCFAAQCVNGVWYSQSWTATAATVASATADGHGGATFVINCVPTSTCYNGYVGNGGAGTQTSAPITVGQWFHIAGITDTTNNYNTTLNGDFRATSISGAVGSAFTITTSPTGPYPDDGTVSGGQFDYGNDQSLVLRGATLQQPAAGSPSSLATATFQIDAAPPQNAAYMGGGPGNNILSFRCSTVWWANCINDWAELSIAEGGYVEFFSLGGTPGMSSAVREPGYSPHTAITQAFSGTGCSINSPCNTTLTSVMWLLAHIQVPSQHSRDIGGAAGNFSIMPADYCPQCVGQPSTAVPGINRNQFEVIQMAAYGTTGGAVTGRNLSGTTTPANTVWPAGSIVGNNIGSTFLSGDDSLTIRAIHTSGIASIASTLFNSVANDQTAVMSANYIIGAMYDGLTIVPPPQTGGYGGNVSAIMEDVNGNPCSNGSPILYGSGCIKITRGVVTLNDSFGVTSDQTPENTPAAAGIVPNGFGQGVIAVNYNEALSGTANVSSATNSVVTSVSGNTFVCLINGDPITINGVGYTILSVSNTSSLTLTTNAGAQTGVAYSFNVPCTVGARASNPTRGAYFYYNNTNFARNQGTFFGTVTTQANINKGGLNQLPGLNTFTGTQNANGYAITDLNGSPFTFNITSWAFTAPATVTFQASNNLNFGQCVVITGLVIGAMFNSPYSQCLPVGAPLSTSQFSINYLNVLQAFPPLSVPVGATETGLATYPKFGIMWYIEGGPFFSGANICEVVAFPTGSIGQLTTPAVKNCATNTLGVYTSLFTPNDFPVMANWPNTGVDTGVVNALILTLNVSPGNGFPFDGARVTILPAFTNTNTVPSVSVNGGAAHTIRRIGGGPVVVGDLNTDTWASLVYSAATSFWILQNPRVSGIQATLYSAAGTPLPACNSGIKGQQLVVSDATAPTYNGTYTSGGAVAVPVMCNGSIWTTH